MLAAQDLLGEAEVSFLFEFSRSTLNSAALAFWRPRRLHVTAVPFKVERENSKEKLANRNLTSTTLHILASKIAEPVARMVTCFRFFFFFLFFFFPFFKLVSGNLGSIGGSTQFILKYLMTKRIFSSGWVYKKWF